MVVRALVGDDPRQTAEAIAILARGFSLSASVLLEIEWVLKSTYRWPREAIADGLRNVIDLPSLDTAPAHIAWAIDRFAAGADFADVVHVASAATASAFVTFDRRLARKAGADTPVPIETLA